MPFHTESEKKKNKKNPGRKEALMRALRARLGGNPSQKELLEAVKLRRGDSN